MKASRRNAPAAPLADDLGDCAARYRAGRRACRRHPSVRRVHLLRAEARQLLVRIILAEAIVRGEAARPARRCLRRHLHALGRLRDLQLQLKGVRPQAPRIPQLDALVRDLEQRRGRAIAQLRTELARGHLGRHLRAVARRIRALPGDANAARTAERRLRQALAHAQRIAQQRFAAGPTSGPAWHRARVALKRYHLMLGVTAMPRGSRPAHPASWRQRTLAALGAVHDRDVLLHGVARAVRRGLIDDRTATRFRRSLPALAVPLPSPAG